jgi:transcriptional regulator with XRE-family HTH domain
MAKPSCGSRVRKRREDLGLTRERTAIDAGVSVSTLARLELSDKLPRTESLIEIARRLDISIDELLDADTKAST